MNTYSGCRVDRANHYESYASPPIMPGAFLSSPRSWGYLSGIMDRSEVAPGGRFNTEGPWVQCGKRG
jgi:hypothetical protein